jgi:inhibitor of cysteine peptidase
MSKSYFFCASLILSFILLGCSGQPTDTPGGAEPDSGQTGGAIMELTEEQNGGIAALIVNDIVRVQIDGNPTTGFTWEVENLDTSLLEQVGEAEFTAKNNLPGGGGTFTFTFKALNAGVTHLRLIYHRPFEKNVPPAQIFDVTVDIQN